MGEEINNQRFSVVKKCPRCGSLSLTVVDGMIQCSNCGLQIGLPRIK